MALAIVLDDARPSGVPTAVLGVPAGVLATAGVVTAFVLYLRWHGVTLEPYEPTGGRDRRLVRRCISRAEPAPPHLRDLVPRNAARIADNGHWAIGWLLFLALVAGFNAAVQPGWLRPAWFGLLALLFGFACWQYRFIRRARALAQRAGCG